jgi:hypothetical protein
MAEFTNIRTVGRNSTLNVAIAGVSNDPSSVTMLPLGAITTKSFSIDGNTLEANDSFASSGYTENQLATSSLSLSVSGNYIRAADDYPNYTFINALLKHRATAISQDLSTDPVILVEYVRPDITITFYALISSISVEDPDAELSTFTMELVNATSPDYPPTFVDTVSA